MRSKLLAILTAGMLTLGTANLMAFDPPRRGGSCPNPNCPTGGVPKKDGTGPGWKKGQQNGAPGMKGPQNGAPGMKGRRTGPRDGSGPIHTPQRPGRGPRR